MEKRMFKVEDRFCDECVLALRRYIGHMDGVESIDVENKMIAVVFDPLKMPEERLNEITVDSLEKLGHKLIVQGLVPVGIARLQVDVIKHISRMKGGAVLEMNENAGKVVKGSSRIRGQDDIGKIR